MSLFNRFTCYCCMIWAALFFIAAWINLVKKRISRYGPDAWIFFLYSLIRREKVEKYNLHENPTFIHNLGTITLALGFGNLNLLMELIQKNWAYLH
jgi:hypothetical protein